MSSTLDIIDINILPEKVVSFKDCLITNFFLPRRSTFYFIPMGRRKKEKNSLLTFFSQSKPVLANRHSIHLLRPLSLQRKLSPGPAYRIATLRRDCLIRDKYRCVITRNFDRTEARRRVALDGPGAVDDDGQVLDGSSFLNLEVAHILPRLLTNFESNLDLVTAREIALDILNMFDMNINRLMAGTDIGRPTNALTLTVNCHDEFGAFRIYFEATNRPHTYRIQSYDLPLISAVPQAITRVLTLSPTIDSPHPRLLAVHAAIARVLHLSSAGPHWSRHPPRR